MSAISTYLEYIRSKIYAKDVRTAIVNAISQCYDDVNAPALQTEAMQAAVQAKIDAGQMAALTIADGSLTGAKLADGTIPTAKIADDAITTAKIVNGAVTANKIASGVIPNTDTTLTQAGIPADAKAVGDLKDNLDDIRIPLGVNFYDYNNIAYDLGIDNTTGAESYTRLYNSCDFIAVDPNTNYIIKSFEYSGNASHRIYEYDATKTFIRRRVKAISADPDGWVITTHANSAYIRLSFESENNTSATQNEKKIVFAKGLSSVTEYIPYYTAYDRVARLLDSKKLDIPSTERFLSCDLNDISTNGIYGLDSSQTYEHAPAGIRAGLFVCLVAHTTIFQFVQAFSASKRYYRRRIATGEFSNWMLTDGDAISGEGYHLDSTGTTADVTANIESILTQYGICHLGSGDFYVSGIDMPENSMLCGCGPATRVILLGTHTDSGYAIKLNHRCEIRDMTISGSAIDRTYADVSSDITQRHGILFEANAYNGSSVDSNSFVDKCNLSNLWIKNFTGGGITANNTGYGVQSCMNVNNVYTFFCNIGINIAFFSEFHRFTNCQAWCCYYGVINNGGNNIFAACSFGRNRLGFLMDNSSGNMRNNSHGTITGCAFVHTDLNALYDNAGVGLKLIGLQYGQIISNCQVGLSDIVVENCKGIQFSNINIASRCNIRVSKGNSGGLVMFNDMIAVSPDTFTLSVDEGYTLCKFNNCWDANGNPIAA